MSTPGAVEEEKPLSYCQRFKQECSQAAGLCMWDGIVEKIKKKGKDAKQSSSTQEVSPAEDTEAHLQQQKEEYEKQLQTQKDEHDTKIQDLQAQFKEQQLSFDQKLAQQQQNSHQQLEEVEKTIERLKQELQESEKRSMEVQNSTEQVQQYEFVVPNFSQLKKDKVKFNTPPMYSRPGGYKFVVEISIAGSYVSIRVFTSFGDYDEKLKFPAKLHITLQLLHHEHKREGHYTKKIACVYKESSKEKFLGSDSHFISLAELEKNAAIYLENDQLWFRITKVKVDTLKSK